VARTRLPLDSRLHLRWSRVLVAVALAISILAGCGGHSKHSATQGQGVGNAFAAKALAVCASAQTSKDGWSAFPVTNFDPSKPNQQDLPQVAAWLENEVAPTFKAWRDGLAALGAPPTGHKAWAEVLAAVTRIAHLNATQVAAAKKQDTAAFAEATKALGQVQPQLERAAADAGVAKCAAVHAG
jgi:hypothetical protein